MPVPKTIDPRQTSLIPVKPLNALGEWEECRQNVLTCGKCHLARLRKMAVFGEGPIDDVPLMLIGEGPGANEDDTGRPFIGKAGSILDRALISIGVERSRCYISNVVKCRPPDNRVPIHEEVEACRSYLFREIRIVTPRVIVCLGRTAAELLLNKKLKSVEAQRNQWFQWDNIPVRVTYHPAFIGRSPDKGREFQTDLAASKDKSGYGN